MRLFWIGLLFMIYGLPLLAQKIQNPTEPYTSTKGTYRKLTDILSDHNPQTLEKYIVTQCPRLVETHSGLTLDFATTSQGGHHARFLQTFHGIPIYQGSVKINLTHENRVLNILEHIYSFTAVQSHFSIDYAPIFRQLTEVWGGNPYFILRIDSIWYPVNNELIAAYWFRTEADSKGSQEFIYSASTGELLLQRVTAMGYQNHISQADTNGKGLVFRPDPLTKNQVHYGGQYRDFNNATNSALDASRDTVVLRDLSYNNGIFTLEGPYVKIKDIEFPSVPPATSTDGLFYFSRDQKGFEDVNAYYHIDLMQRYIQSLGFMNLGNFPISVDAHGNFNQDNSYFIAGVNSFISFGDGGVDDAEDADVCTHEYGHCLSESGSPNTNNGYERLGLDEGIGDYIQASYSRSISLYEWDATFSWDGHNEYWAGRSCNITTPYLLLPNSSYYAQGSLWCTAMMKPQNFLSREVCDKIFFQELYMNNNNMTLVDAARLVLDADTLLNNGLYSPYYISAFCQTGILSGDICLSVARETLSSGTWSVFPNPCYQSLLIRDLPMDKAVIRIIDLHGKIWKEWSLVGNSEIELHLSDLHSGLYIIEYQSDKSKESRKFSKY